MKTSAFRRSKIQFVFYICGARGKVSANKFCWRHFWHSRESIFLAIWHSRNSKNIFGNNCILSYQVFLPYIVSLIWKNNELLNGSLNTFDISDVFGYFWVLDNLGIVLGSLEFLLIIWTPVVNLIKSLESQLKSLQS